MTYKNIDNLNIMIKPASSACNLSCKYCFYLDEAKNRMKKSYGMMSIETVDRLLKDVFSSVETRVSFLFQGGEPTLRGIDFFKKFHELVDLYNTNNIQTNFAIQTNGILIDEDWINLFKKYSYLVGVSLDGMKDCHDYARLDKEDMGTFDRVMENIYLLQKENVPINILTVVNNKNVNKAKEIYEFYKENNFNFLQFIPAISPIKSKNLSSLYLDPKEYGLFLDSLFNLWYKDIFKGHFRSIRYFENLLMIILYGQPEACDMMGTCSVSPVLEADGSVYPCDFYSLDKNLLGNINEDSLVDLIKNKNAQTFVNLSYQISPRCKSCKFLNLCRGGCRRYKNENLDNILCQGFYYFFDKNEKKLFELASYIRNLQMQD